MKALSTHKKVLLLYLCVLIVLMVLVYVNHIPFYPLVLSFIAYLILLIAGSSYLRLQYYMPVKNQLNDKTKVALTFDDGPDSEVTPQLLAVLERHNVKASFFCIGEKIEKNKELAQRIVAEGHILGNHSYHHSNYFPIYSVTNICNELDKTNILIEEIAKQKNVYFRPPFGVTNPSIAKAVKKMNLKAIGWNVRTFDTVRRNEKLLKKLNKKITGGEIILFHDTHIALVEIVDSFIESCKKKGLEFITIQNI
ncbi:polysaccharide deacetylase family protein [Maribellus mangrovi]|uniref:polysaccharide deacetylase family protein n=1 Tax=Maribellus mangrovi TaxID=3133146 RepID=UPI0030EBE9A8